MRPNFLVIGGARAGTTSLYAYLRQHPQIFLSAVKEPQFFALHGARPDFRGPGDAALNRQLVYQRDRYDVLFAGAGGARAIGEMSQWYLSAPGTAARIHDAIPGVRLVAVLRHPVDRAWSAYLRLVRDGHETLSIADALAAEDARVLAGWSPLWHYARRGFYATFLSEYVRVFGADRVRVYLYDDLVADAVGLVRDLCGFLDVDPAAPIDTSLRLNASGVPRSRAAQAVIAAVRPAWQAGARLIRSRRLDALAMRATAANLRPARLPDDVRRDLADRYRDDLAVLEDLLHRDLGAWRRQDAAPAT